MGIPGTLSDSGEATPSETTSIGRLQGARSCRAFRLFTSSCQFAFYGVFRLNALKSAVCCVHSGLWGMVDSMEYPLLAQIALLGRIVALPSAQITGRLHPNQVYRTDGVNFSNSQRFLNDLHLIKNMLRRTVRQPDGKVQNPYPLQQRVHRCPSFGNLLHTEIDHRNTQDYYRRRWRAWLRKTNEIHRLEVA